MATERWYNDSNSLRTFQTALINAEILEDTDEVLAFNAHPQRFNEMYEAWENAGFPTTEDSEWDEFVEAISGEDSEEEEDATS